MGLGVNHTTTVTSDKFIPEMWSDEVIASYKAKLVLGNLVTPINFKGKKATPCTFQCLAVARLLPKLHLLKSTWLLIQLPKSWC